MAERLSISMLKQEVEVYNESVDIPFVVGDKEINVKLKPFFSPTLIRDIVSDITLFFLNADKEKLIIDKNEEDDIVGYFILRHCTDIKFSKGKKAKTLYDEFKILVNSQIFKVLLDAIPQESIASVYDTIYEVIEVSTKFQKQLKKYQEQIKELPLKNREILIKDGE
jgi:hypothetical protein